jgi:hypothetical protein
MAEDMAGGAAEDQLAVYSRSLGTTIALSFPE